jgi:hypothetical protein
VAVTGDTVLGRATPTFLNVTRIEGPQPLKAGDRIGVGESTFEFLPAADLAPAVGDGQQTRQRRVEHGRARSLRTPGAEGELRILWPRTSWHTSASPAPTATSGSGAAGGVRLRLRS